METYQLFIDGQWISAADGATFDNQNPAQPDEIVGRFASATTHDAKRAIAAARQSAASWAATPAPNRGAILFEASKLIEARTDELATTLTREEGKTQAEATGEVTRARDILRYYAGEGWRMGGDVLPSNVTGELLYTRREPLGVIGIITPWNYPIAIPAWKMAPALAYGNSVVFKPASHAPLVGLMLVEALVDAGLPDGVVNLLTGSGSIVGEALVTSPDVDGISFTGSRSVGASIYTRAVKNMTRVQLEMGGKNPLIILRDADLDLAIRLAIKGGFGVTGQACTATSRVIVEEAIADAFAEALVEATRALRVGDGLEADTDMGPAVDQGQMNTDLKYVEIGREEGARLLTGGEPAKSAGFFVQPTVFDAVEPQMRIAQEEIFGPIVGIIRASDAADALQKANAIGYGLSASVVTQDLHQAMAFANGLEAGVVKVNEATTGLALQAPFGGFKDSSANTFKEQGQAAIEFYTRIKTVYLGYA
jgi:aldehyde dehydrogenase (NAD+)